MLELLRLRSVNDLHFWTAIELYVESFPRDERMPVEEIAASLSQVDESFYFYVASLAQEFAGLVIALRLKCDLHLVTHLVLPPKFRGQKLGATLMEQVADEFAPPRAILLEVERLCDSQTDEMKAIRTKRLAFFSELGAEAITPDYTQPKMAPDRSEVLLNLLAFRRNSRECLSEIVKDFMLEIGFDPEGEPTKRALAGVGLPLA